MDYSIKMIEELKSYLYKENENFYEESFNFKGLRKNIPQLNGEKRNLFIISYLSSISDIKYDSDSTFYAYFDENKRNLLYIIGPQSYKNIDI